MTTATATLRKEHEAILRMLDATEATARLIESGVLVSAETLQGFLEFFQLFADRCHHGKEEELLFPLLEQKGLPRHGGPLGVMLSEHAMGRSLIQRMADAAAGYSAGDRTAAVRWAQASTEYAALLRSHIHKENEILFVMAERILSESEQSQTADAFERLEIEKMGAGTHERLHALMAKLISEVTADAARKA